MGNHQDFSCPPFLPSSGRRSVGPDKHGYRRSGFQVSDQPNNRELRQVPRFRFSLETIDNRPNRRVDPCIRGPYYRENDYASPSANLAVDAHGE